MPMGKLQNWHLVTNVDEFSLYIYINTRRMTDFVNSNPDSDRIRYFILSALHDIGWYTNQIVVR